MNVKEIANDEHENRLQIETGVGGGGWKQSECQNKLQKLPNREEKAKSRKTKIPENFRKLLEETRDSITIIFVKTLKMKQAWKTRKVFQNR